MAFSQEEREVGDYIYSLNDCIGRGAYSNVYRGRHRENLSIIVAIKVVSKTQLHSADLLAKEIEMLQELASITRSGNCHKNLVALWDVHETPRKSYLVMEYCNGGDLQDYLTNRDTLSETMIQVIANQLVSAIAALRGKDIVHR